MRTSFAGREWLPIGGWLLMGMGIADLQAQAIDRAAVQSGSITSIGYGNRLRALEIEFRSGGIYRYREVPESIFLAFLQAKSKGRFFGARIRGRYAFEKTLETRP